MTLRTVTHRLLISWDFPSRNTSVGCHFFSRSSQFRIEPISPALTDGSFTTEPIRLNDQKWEMYWRSLGETGVLQRMEDRPYHYSDNRVVGEDLGPLVSIQSTLPSPESEQLTFTKSCHTVSHDPCSLVLCR